jgi:sulfonate transport system substrate-binding protein
LPGAGSFYLAADKALADPGKSAALDDYLERRFKAQAWINSHPDIWVEEYYVKERHQTPENAKVVVAGTGTIRFTPITDEVQAAHQHLADLLQEAGALEGDVDVAAVYDAAVVTRSNSILEEIPQP